MVSHTFRIENDHSIKKQKNFYTEHFSHYLLFTLNYLSDEEACKDIVQEAFICYWKQQDRFDDEISAKAFLYKTIRNSCLNHIRHFNIRSKYYASLPSEWETEDFFMENVIREEVSTIILTEINKLSETGRKVLLRSLDGYSNEEIAEELEISVNTVKTHKARSYIILRKNLEYLRTFMPFLNNFMI